MVIKVSEVKPVEAEADGTVEVKAQTPMEAVAVAEEFRQSVQVVDQDKAVAVLVELIMVLAAMVVIPEEAVDMVVKVGPQVHKAQGQLEVTLFL